LFRSGRRASSRANNIVGRGRITEDKTVAWIGTNLGRARRYRWQVQLAVDEPVTILGSSQREGPDGVQTWYRIVPPSGEFRWIHRNQTVTTAEELVATLQKQHASDIDFLPGGPTSAPRRAEPRFVEDLPDDFEVMGDPFDDGNGSRSSRSRRAIADSNSSPDVELDESTNNGKPEFKSLPQRISEGLSVLLKGRDVMPDLEPITRSSRRIADLVPIGSAADAFESSQLNSEIEDRNLIARQSDEESSVEKSTREVMDTATSESAVASHTDGSMPMPVQTAFAEQMPPTTTPPAAAVTQAPQNSIVSFASSPRLADSRGRSSLKPLRQIDATQIEEVQRQIASADAASLPSLFSMMVARAASAPEVGLLAEAAERGGNRALADRARQYQTVARRRDGDTIVRSVALQTPIVPAPQIPASNASVAVVSFDAEPVTKTNEEETDSSDDVTLSGELVQVYSADPHRPPYALVDNAGRTLAYVTPAPGIEVEDRLGVSIIVAGQQGFLRGLDTPHVLATRISRR
ncbi:MAG: hypothetical protein AAF745_14130, partial [Planctomycetota bacterium]